MSPLLPLPAAGYVIDFAFVGDVGGGAVHAVAASEFLSGERLHCLSPGVVRPQTRGRPSGFGVCSLPGPSRRHKRTHEGGRLPAAHEVT
jgi:hypothetical protein